MQKYKTLESYNKDFIGDIKLPKNSREHLQIIDYLSSKELGRIMSKQKWNSMPNIIYIFKDKDGEEEYFIASDNVNNLSDINEDKIIGVYELKEVKTLKTEIKLV